MAIQQAPAAGGPAFIACLTHEFQQGLVSKGLFREFMQAWNSPAHGGPNTLDAAARTDLILKDLQKVATEERRRGYLQWKAARDIAQAMQVYRNRKGEKDAGEFALELLYSVRAGMTTVDNRAEALFGAFQTQLVDLIRQFRRSDLTGFTRNKAGLADVIRELDGQATGNADAAAMAKAWMQVSEQARVMFNAAGGDIPKIPRWIMPQIHNPARVGRDRDAWIDFITPRLDAAAMGLNPAELQQALEHIWATITTQGRGELEATMRGGGSSAMALTRNHERFLLFKDADGWMQYQEEFGSGTLIDVMLSHIRGMSKDIATMQVLGPNPDKTIDWLQQTIDHEQSLAARGDPSAVFPERDGIGRKFDDYGNPNQHRADYAKEKREALRNAWNVLTSRIYMQGNMDLANGIGTAKNVFLANALGATTIIAQVDHVVATVARLHAGLPAWRTLGDYFRAIGPGGREEALELGIIVESALNTFMTEMRYLGPIMGQSWSRWLVDRSMTVSLLKPHTAAMKNAMGFTAFRHIAKQRNKAWADLNPDFRNFFERYGLVEQDWDAIRSTPTSNTGRGLEVIHHRDIAGPGLAPAVQPRAGLTPRQELALRVLEMVRGETEPAVPSGNLRTRKLTSGIVPPGTAAGVVWSSIISLKTYALSTHTIHMYRVYETLQRQGAAPAAMYVFMLVMGGTSLALLMMQAKEMFMGREPMNMDDPTTYVEAYIKGTAMGLFSEPLLYREDSEGKDILYALMGPLIDQLATTTTAGISSVDEVGTWITGEERQTNAGRDAMKLLKKIMPFSSTWYAALAIDRLVYDNLQRQVDAEAEESFQRRRQYYEDKKGQQYWWAPGEGLPSGE